ncbi:19938_t:CDS:2, partial [Gigaspora margarita]
YESHALYEKVMFISEMKKQLVEQEGCVLQLGDEYNYETINNLLELCTKGCKYHKRITEFHNSTQKKVLKETTNIKQNKDLMRTASSKISNKSINIDNIEEQNQIVY